MTVSLQVLQGAPLDAVLDDLAALRIEVFRAFPYLYDGDLNYERRYLESYRNNADAVLIAAFDGAKLVGAATAATLASHETAFQEPVSVAGIDIAKTLYCAESVLLPDWRGRGLGHAFFDQREAWGIERGLKKSVFCAVRRANDHPARPLHYRSLEPFWKKRGYEPLPGAVARFDWKEVGGVSEVSHDMDFWWRGLPAS